MTADGNDVIIGRHKNNENAAVVGHVPADSDFLLYNWEDQVEKAKDFDILISYNKSIGAKILIFNWYHLHRFQMKAQDQCSAVVYILCSFV